MFCLLDGESVNHNFIHCQFVRGIWLYLLGLFGIVIVLPYYVCDLFLMLVFSSVWQEGQVALEVCSDCGSLDYLRTDNIII